MSVTIKKDDTEITIKNTAKRLFFGQGKFNATTQEIADAAGVNRTLINYYFRSRDNLIKIIFDEAKAAEKEKIEVIKLSNLPFRQKMENFIEISLNSSLQYPYLESYIVSQMNRDNNCFQKNELDDTVTRSLYKEIESEMELGNITKMEPVQFLLNMISLLIFPTAMRPLLMDNLLLGEEEFDKVISERKDIIVNMLFKN